jgi:hypothetical protein
MTSEEAPIDWNACRYNGGDHVESFFIKAVCPRAERALWIKATVFGRAEEPELARAEGWAVVFDRRPGSKTERVAVKHSLSLAQVEVGTFRAGMRWQRDDGQGLRLEPGICSGRIANGDDRIEWHLEYTNDEKPFVMLPHMRLYSAPFPSSKTVTPAPNASFEGQLTVNGEVWRIDSWPGMQGHNWGKGHAESYAWSHCNHFDGYESLAVEAVSARVRVGRVLSPVLSIVYLRFRGADFHFSAIPNPLSARGTFDFRSYRFTGKASGVRVQALVEASANDFVGLYYANPQGPTTHCLNAKLATMRLSLQLPGSKPIETRSSAAALEIGTLGGQHGVQMHV